MRKETIKRKIYYRWCSMASGELQEKIAEALSREELKDANNRIESTHEGMTSRLINRSHKIGGMNFYELVTFEPGRVPQIIKAEDGKSAFDVKELSKEDRTELVQNSGYFGVLGNHVIGCQSAGVRFSTLAEHLAWLFSSAIGVELKSEDIINLVVPLKEHVKTKLAQEEFKRVRIASDVQPLSGAEDKKEFHQLGYGALQLLKEYGLLNIDIEQLTDTASLKLFLEIKLAGRKSDPTNEKMLSALVNSIPPGEAVDFLAETKSGSRYTSEEVSIGGEIKIEVINKIPDINQLFLAMHDWFANKNEQGEIPEFRS